MRTMTDEDKTREQLQEEVRALRARLAGLEPPQPRESEARYRLLFERNLAGVVHSTVGGRLLDCNESFARMLGCASREEVLAHSAQDFYFRAEDRELHLTRLWERLAVTNYEMCLRRRDGRP